MKVKKIISIFLCVSMVFGVMSVGMAQAFASEHDYSKCPYNTGYTWDFSTGSAESVNGDPKNMLSYVLSAGGDESINISDGELHSHQTTMQMSQPVTLNSSNDWTVEIVAKSDGTDSFKTVLSTALLFASSSYIYMNANGEMFLTRRGTLPTDGGTALASNYTYYKVSQADYDNSILNSPDFDVTEYHTYQMKCIGGVFSTWVDGEKIGNLSMSEQSASSTRSTDINKIYTGGTGTPFNEEFSNMSMNYIGNGRTSRQEYAYAGLRADVKYLGIYTGHTFDDACDTDCNNEGCDYVRVAPHSFEPVSSIDATCTSRGETKYQCSLCGLEKTENTIAKTGYTWDFSTGSAESVNGDPKNKLSLVYSQGETINGATVKNTSVDISDGELQSHRSIFHMSKSVTLDSSNDWTAEIVAKGNGTDAIRTVFSTARGYGSAKFIYINGSGDMFLGVKGSLTTNDGNTTTDYTYYKTSNEDYNKSILKRDSFKVTDYHTYQMKCIGGVFSTWVDGEKIGDLCMTEFESFRADSNPRYTQGTGTPFDFSRMVMTHVGNGANSNANYGLTATVKYLGIYTGHTFDSVCDATCNKDGCDYERVAPHSWDDGVVTVFPTDTEEGEKIYTCTLCGETKTESIPCVSKQEHYVWDYSKVTDFDNPNIANTSGASLDNELALVKTSISGVTSASQLVSNGTLNLTKQATFKLSKPITLNAENDWMVELVAKGDGTNLMRSFLSEGVSISSATYFYIDGSGDLSIVKKGSYTDDLGVSQSGYTYYKVSDASYNKSVLASGNFDITEYHTYQVRCIDGTFSYWLDGDKIGDYVLSETSSNRSVTSDYTEGNGTPFDFSTITVNYSGCGSSTNAANQALTGTVKSMAIYPNTCELDFSVGLDGADAIDPIYDYPCKEVTLPTPVAEGSSAVFLGWNDKPDGSGNMYDAGGAYELSGLEKQGLYGIWGGDITIQTSGDASGTVTADVEQAKMGDTVTLTVDPAEGCVLKNISADDDVTLTTDDGGVTYTFTMPAHSVTVNAEFDFEDGIGALLAGHSISLDGDIAVNFYMELSESVANSDTAYMQFSVPNTSTEYQDQTVKVSKAEKKGNYYVFNCRVAAKDMKSQITAQIVDGDQTGTEYTYSVKEYADYLIEHQDDSATFKKAVPLVQAMLRYGENAEYYFDKTSTQPEDIEVTIPEKDAEVSVPNGVTFNGATLSLKSRTSLSLYFYSTEDITLSAKDKNGNPLVCDRDHQVNDYVIRIRNISAKELNDNFTVTVEVNGESGTVTYSPLTYCYKVLMSETTDNKLKNTVKALYQYWEEAEKYFG